MTVAYQAINFALYVAILVYVLRQPIKTFFRTREETYKQSLIKAENARRAAELKKREIQDRLHKLESSSHDSIATAKAEALALTSQIQQQAEQMSARLKQEAQRSVENELERAKTELRQDMLNQAVVLARKLLADKMAEPDQKRLQTEFVDKIREVHP